MRKDLVEERDIDRVKELLYELYFRKIIPLKTVDDINYILASFIKIEPYKCHVCQTHISPNGSEVELNFDIYKCIKCGNGIDENDRFCSKCGQAIKWKKDGE